MPPLIIVNPDAINQYSPVIVIVPLTKASNVTREYPNNVLIEKGESGLRLESVALGGQVRAIASSRLLRYRGTLLPETMRRLDQALRITLDLSQPFATCRYEQRHPHDVIPRLWQRRACRARQGPLLVLAVDCHVFLTREPT